MDAAYIRWAFFFNVRSCHAVFGFGDKVGSFDLFAYTMCEKSDLLLYQSSLRPLGGETLLVFFNITMRNVVKYAAENGNGAAEREFGVSEKLVRN